jgi:hypothetical protein
LACLTIKKRDLIQTFHNLEGKKKRICKIKKNAANVLPGVYILGKIIGHDHFGERNMQKKRKRENAKKGKKELTSGKNAKLGQPNAKTVGLLDY